MLLKPLKKYAHFHFQQSFGIFSSDLVCYPDKGINPEGDKLLNKLGIEDERRMMIFIADTISLSPDSSTKPDNKSPIILLGSRLNLSSQKDKSLGAKCVDIFLNGYLNYIKSGGIAKLKIFEKGDNIQEVMAWLAQRGLDEKVIVEKQVPLATFYQHIRSANIIADSFGYDTHPGMVTTDSYALGKPVIANLRHDIFGTNEIPRLPGLNATTPDEVSNQLFKEMNHIKSLEELGQKSRVFAENKISPENNARRLLKKVEFIMTRNNN